MKPVKRFPVQKIHKILLEQSDDYKKLVEEAGDLAQQFDDIAEPVTNDNEGLDNAYRVREEARLSLDEAVVKLNESPGQAEEEQMAKALNDYLVARKKMYEFYADETLRELMAARLKIMQVMGDEEYEEFKSVDKKIQKEGKREEIIYWLGKNDETHTEEIIANSWGE
jgi:hypothetical protein